MADGTITVEEYGDGTRYALVTDDERVAVVEGTALPPGTDPDDPDPPDVLVHDAPAQTDELAGRRMRARGDEATVAALATTTGGDGLFDDLLGISMEGTAALNAGWQPLDDVGLVGDATVVAGTEAAGGPVLVMQAGDDRLVHASPRAVDGLDEALDDLGLDPTTADVHVRGTDAERVDVDEALAAAQSGDTRALDGGDDAAGAERDGEEGIGGDPASR